MKTLPAFLRMILIVVTIGMTNMTMAQDGYVQNGNETAEQQALVLAKAYEGELDMSAEQAVLFQKKLEEFVIRANTIKARDFTTEEKLRLLTTLSEQETVEMGTILTLPQVRRYQELKKTIQPIAVVVGETN